MANKEDPRGEAEKAIQKALKKAELEKFQRERAEEREDPRKKNNPGSGKKRGDDGK